MSKRQHGENATSRMKANVQAQLKRLLEELEDLEEMKDDMDEEEYEEAKAETIKEMEAFSASLSKDLSLVSDLGRVQLAIQASIKGAFKTPEVIRMFAQKHPEK